MTNENNSVEEITLTPEEPKIENAQEIANKSVNEQKYKYIITYTVADKQLLMSELTRIGCIVESISDAESKLVVEMSDLQLAAIKTLNCIERVETAVSLEETMVSDENSNSYLNKVSENAILNTVKVDDEIKDSFTIVETTATVSDYSISLMCDCDTDSDCNCSNNISSAIELNLNSWKSGEICCCGSSVWYTFTTESGNNRYIIRTTGGLDTIGYLYDCCCNQVGYCDDAEGSLNFKIFEQLEANKRYYICVKAYGNNIGDFRIKVSKCCGGANYKDVTKHTMVLQDDGYYACSKCDYRIKSPELEDKHVLSKEDYLMVVSAQQMYVHYEHLIQEKPSAAVFTERQERIDKLISSIRRKSIYKDQYSFMDSNGYCHGAEVVENYYQFISTGTLDIFNISNYNGIYEMLHDLIFGYFSPPIMFVKDILDFLTGEINALEFSASAADIYGFKKISNALTIASGVLAFIDSDIELGDFCVEVEVYPYIGHYIYSDTGKLKMVKIEVKN